MVNPAPLDSLLDVCLIFRLLLGFSTAASKAADDSSAMLASLGATESAVAAKWQLKLLAIINADYQCRRSGDEVRSRLGNRESNVTVFGDFLRSVAAGSRRLTMTSL